MSTARACLASAILVVTATTAAGCAPRTEAKSPAEAPSTGTTPTSRAEPPWVGTYDADQKAVLALPLDAPVERPAQPVYPSLSHFTFTGEGQIRVPEDPLAFANLVTEALSASPRLYVFRDGPSSLANLAALFGPKPADNPDPWRRVVADASKRPSLEPALPSDKVRALLEKASKQAAPDNITTLQQAAQHSPEVPGVHATLADAALAAGDLAVAAAAAQAALAVDPSFPQAYRILAEIAFQQGDQARAKKAIARALALYPTYPRAWKVAEAIAGRTLERVVRIEQPFIEVNDKGAIVVVACDRPMCAGYAACKAAFRFEPSFRASILKESPTEPYHLSATEEVVCLEAGLGTHLEEQKQNRAEGKALSDPHAEMLIRLAAESGLTAFAMFEVLGTHRPEWLRVAPAPVHDAIVSYVLNGVLSTTPSSVSPDIEGPGDGQPGITASLTGDFIGK